MENKTTKTQKMQMAEKFEIIKKYANSKSGYVSLIREPMSKSVMIWNGDCGIESELAYFNSQEGVFFDLEPITCVYVSDCNGLKSKMDSIFAESRVRPDRDFFAIDENVAVETLYDEVKNFI